MRADFAALARLLLREEGVASSFIEGLTAPVVDIVLAEADEGGTPSAAAWVAANLAAVTEAIDGAHAGPLTIDNLRQWHRTLMTGSPTPPQHVGVLRVEQGWIGGMSPLDANLVPPEQVPALIDDLIVYVNRDHVDPVSQAAIAHVQFEIIHPFADGTGRVGRVPVAWVLVRRLSLLTPPPVSARIAADVGGYGVGRAAAARLAPTTWRLPNRDAAPAKQRRSVARAGPAASPPDRSWRASLPSP